jgi:ketosteroid isomerase-like protein
MKKLLFICLCLLITTTSYATDETAVAKAVSDLTKALIDADAKALDKLTAEKLSYGHSSGIIEDKTTFMEKIVSGRSDFVKINLDNQNISISNDVALVRHDLKADIFDGGKPASIHLGVLLVWQKQSGEWKLLARQAIKYLPTNP